MVAQTRHKFNDSRKIQSTHVFTDGNRTAGVRFGDTLRGTLTGAQRALPLDAWTVNGRTQPAETPKQQPAAQPGLFEVTA